MLPNMRQIFSDNALGVWRVRLRSLRTEAIHHGHKLYTMLATVPYINN